MITLKSLCGKRDRKHTLNDNFEHNVTEQRLNDFHFCLEEAIVKLIVIHYDYVSLQKKGGVVGLA